MEDVLILNQQEVKQCLSMKEAIKAVKIAYSAFVEGRVEMPPVQHLDVKQYNGEVDIKSSYVEDFGLIATKVASGFYDNPAKGLPPGTALIVLLDLETSLPLAIIDGTHITAYRTGAAGAVAASVLARKDSTEVGILGAGTQGRMQLLGLFEEFDIMRVKIWDINSEAAEKYASEMTRDYGVDIEVVSNPEHVVPGSDILVTATPSRKPLITAKTIHEGMHINAIGADGPGKQELEPSVATLASKIVVDSLAQCKRIGELQHAFNAGLIDDAKIHAEIGQILVGKKDGRNNESEITLFDATGLSAQDVAAAKIVLDAAKSKGLGKSVRLL